MANYNGYKLSNTWLGYFISQYLVDFLWHVFNKAFVMFGRDIIPFCWSQTSWALVYFLVYVQKLLPWWCATDFLLDPYPETSRSSLFLRYQWFFLQYTNWSRISKVAHEQFWLYTGPVTAKVNNKVIHRYKHRILVQTNKQTNQKNKQTILTCT